MKHWVALLVCSAFACGNPSPERAKELAAERQTEAQRGEPVEPPFVVRGDLEGLLLVWYDDEGKPHAAERRSDIPEAHRDKVRVDSLEVAPDERLDPGHVYVADLRTPVKDGRYRVERWARDAFEAAVVEAAARPSEVAQDDQAEVVLYSASWCGVCKQAKQFLTDRGIPFVEKDIEKQPGARAEMLAKAKAQGMSPRGVPVIDVKGKLLAGFSPQAVMAALGR